MNTEGLSNACKAKNNDSQTGSTGLIQTHVTSAMGLLFVSGATQASETKKKMGSSRKQPLI